ncbi:hypothetical protein ACFY12_27320 [Streptomyces sp. NPDC001339]|uniref:hypothetical protein n=1 Tax=Streptomyces sp. NPDC001339 TaxID=3364563 RepID=UPI0036BFFCED
MPDLPVTLGRAAQQSCAAGELPPLVPGSRSLRALLPESYRHGDFADRLLLGFDDTIAPVIRALDCLDAYFDPRTAPADFLDWMLAWTGTEPAAPVAEPGRRRALRLGARLQGLRGTRAGLELFVREVLGGEVQLAESGGTYQSPRPDECPAAAHRAWAEIRVVLPAAATASDGCTTTVDTATDTAVDTVADTAVDTAVAVDEATADVVERLVRDWVPADVDVRVRVSVGVGVGAAGSGPAVAQGVV